MCQTGGRWGWQWGLFLDGQWERAAGSGEGSGDVRRAVGRAVGMTVDRSVGWQLRLWLDRQQGCGDPLWEGQWGGQWAGQRGGCSGGQWGGVVESAVRQRGGQ